MYATAAPAATLTVKQWADRWPDHQKVDAQTARHNSQMVRGFVAQFGDRPLTSLERFEVVDWAVSNPGSARYAKTMLNRALELQLITANPLQGFTFHAPGKKDITVLTVDQVERAAAVATETAPAGKGEEFGFMIRLTAYCALRLREAAGLTVENVGMENKYLHIHGKRTDANPTGERKVLVPEFLREELGRRVAAAEGQNLFTSTTGSPLSRQRIGQWWKDVREEIGVAATFHELRHFGISWMIDQGADRQAVSWQCFGHPNSKLIDDLYAHPDRDAALARLAGTLGS